MGKWFKGSKVLTAITAATLGAVVSVAVSGIAGQRQVEVERPAVTPRW